MNLKYALFVLPLLWVMLGCDDPKPVTDALQRAEVLMNEHPDSAWMLLNTLSPDEMGENRTRAHYALLYTQAQDKTYIDETNDSLISVAVDYYRHTDDVRHKFLSHYYKGRVCYNRKDYLSATSCYMEAEQLADEVGDDYLAGLLYGELGRIYLLYYDYSKSLEAYQKSSECYGRAGKISHRDYIWFNLSRTYRNMNQYDDSERWLLKALNSAKETGNRSLVKRAMGNLLMMYVEQKRILEAKELYGEMKSLVGEDYGSAPFMGRLAQMYMQDGNITQAKIYLESGWLRAETKLDSVGLYISSAEINHMLGENQKAYRELLEGVLLQNQEARKALEQPVLTAQRDYLSEKLEFERYRLQLEKRLNLFSTLFFLLLLGILVYWGIGSFRKFKKKSQRIISELKHEKDKISSLLEQLDADKKEADLTITRLKDEIVCNEEKSNAEISKLLLDLEQGKGSIENLKQKLEESEEIRLKMKSLVQKLEVNSTANAESVACLRTELETLQNDNRKILLQKVELLKNHLEHVAGVVLLHEGKYLKAETKERKIKESISSLKKNYFAGDGEYRKMEVLVNLYLDNVMLHFRREVSLPNEADYRRVCYMFAGVSGQIIADVMNESKDAVYQRRSRLLKKIASLSCLHKEMFMLLLCK